MNAQELKQYHEIYRSELFDSVIPFWLNHSLDREKGGYFSLLERDGTVFDTDKYAWMQGREIWMFSKLCSVYGTRPEWLDAARLGVEFMRAHGYAENGDFYFAMDREGHPLIQPYNIFSDCFMCTALVEYARVSGDESAAQEGLRIYRRIQQRKDNPKGIWTKAVPGARNLCAMAMPMIQMMMARELKGFVPDEELTPIIESNLKIFFDRHVDRERKCVFERVLPDGGHMFDIMEGRLLNPGHALENLWFVMDVAHSIGREDMVKDAAEIMLWTVERGWDQQYGGLFYYQDYMGYPTDKLESQMKLWWVHAEAINAFLLAYKLTGSQEHLQWFRRLHAYSFTHFSDRAYGEWYGYLDRQGNPAFGLKGGKWKGFFHLPRMLMVCERWLAEMLEQAP
ncbi:MAG: AGE family epimerase/isomerase [Candidatus Ventricola sp.]|nr:AGE family epimerase/isomerase [Candidatus Ventricola sp.]